MVQNRSLCCGIRCFDFCIYSFTLLPKRAIKCLIFYFFYLSGFKGKVLRAQSYFQLVSWPRADWKNWLCCIFVFSIKRWKSKICHFCLQEEQCVIKMRHIVGGVDRQLAPPVSEIQISKYCQYWWNPHQDLKESSEPVSLFFYQCRSYHMATDRRVHLQFNCRVGTRREPSHLQGSCSVLNPGTKKNRTKLKEIRSNIPHQRFQHACQPRSEITHLHVLSYLLYTYKDIQSKLRFLENKNSSLTKWWLAWNCNFLETFVKERAQFASS